MLQLSQSIAAWGNPEFENTLKQELSSQVQSLPLLNLMQHGSMPLFDDIHVSILGSAESEQTISISLGIFFQSVIAGCHCADDPTPMDRLNEYGELVLEIDKSTQTGAFKT